MEESDSEKKMEKENLGTRMDPPIGEPEGSLGWVLPNTAMKKKVRHVRYIKNMKVKVLLMGKSGSGKTSMRSIIFANYIARDTRRLGATILDRLHSLQINSSLSTYSLVDSVGNTKTFDVEHSHVRFLGNLVLNLWDCGGQDTFMENYFTSQRDNIFRNVEVLIYVFDVESRELEKDMHYYQSCLEAILQNSPDAKIFCLVHKMDLVQEDQRDLIFKEREEDLRRLSRPLECSCFRTSIWDETLYKAWSSIVYQLIPNVQQLEMNLRNFAEIIEADEVLLFERATFLVISHYQCKEQRDVHRFEKISNIIKQFKLSCSKLAASFQSMEVRNSNFAAFIDIFTSNTYVMVVMSDPSIPSAATLINIRNARKHFEKLERVDGPKQCLLMR
ncbi:ras-related GTP-binding protein B isoform X1 [Lagenorhynchus albirostris]|uniref:ras-related GTP-binding protein B isoform X1 n=2 Tax=Sagmatias obliquidens TaxID=3371155 RepID=UPI000F440106|nr:ras-related GTP-binding protein B isoform X1 [Lagenorhynchus obliquidens]XP_030707087.1 ras-related GTP-binding protein B isoform X1 [Globicephala melas]XP_059994187.1 ras-related GTP-binding protein B isoform X1 [Lagenorhynchus albirostris]